MDGSEGNNIILGDRGYIKYLNGFLDEISSTLLDEGLGDKITTGNGDDIVVAGLGNNDVTTGSGSDRSFDYNAVIDFDSAIQLSARTQQLQTNYDCSDRV